LIRRSRPRVSCKCAVTPPRSGANRSIGCSAARWGGRGPPRPFAAALGMAVQVLDELSEVDHGELSGLTRAEIAAAWPGQAEARARDKYLYRFPGGESYADAETRAGRALDRIARSGVRAPLLVSHEMIGRMLLKNLAGLDRVEALRLSHPSDVVYKVHPAPGTIEVLASGAGQRDPLQPGH
jgi:broad specificity phosphatase PhoE